jgi:hypothetical protein
VKQIANLLLVIDNQYVTVIDMFRIDAWQGESAPIVADMYRVSTPALVV